MERAAVEGDGPVRENAIDTPVAPEYRGTREILREPAGTIRQG